RIFRILDAILRSANKRRFHAEYRLEYRSRIGEGKGNAHAKNKGDVFKVLLPGPGIEMPLRNDIEKNYRDRRQGQNRHVENEKVEKPLVVPNDQHWEVDHCQNDDERGGQVPGEAERLLELDSQRKAGVMPDPFEHFEPNLDQSFCPSFLLGLEGIELYW